MLFTDMTFTETLEIVDAYHRLIGALGKPQPTQWEIANILDDNYESQELILAEWSDFGYNEYGSDIDRANVKAFAEIFNGIVRTEDYPNSGRAWIDIGDTKGCSNPAELIEQLEGLIDTMGKLNDYSLIDDEVHSNMQFDDADKAWEDYIAADIINELGEQFPDSQEWFDANEEEFRKHYYEFENWWSYETPTGIVNDKHNDARDNAVRMILRGK